MAGTRMPSASSAAARATASRSSPTSTGTMGDGWPGAQPGSTWPARRALRARALGAGHDGQPRPGPRRCRPGSGAVVKMNGPGQVDQQVDVAAAAGHEPAQRAEGLGQGADPQHLDPVELAAVEVGAEHGVGLVEHEQGARGPAQLGDARHRGHVAVHGEDRVGHHQAPGHPVGPGLGRAAAARCSGSAWR